MHTDLHFSRMWSESYSLLPANRLVWALQLWSWEEPPGPVFSPAELQSCQPTACHPGSLEHLEKTHRSRRHNLWDLLQKTQFKMKRQKSVNNCSVSWYRRHFFVTFLFRQFLPVQLTPWEKRCQKWQCFSILTYCNSPPGVPKPMDVITRL